MSEHIPVLLNEAIDGLNIKPDGIYLDLTLGRAGHSQEILKRLTSGKLIAFDQDEEAIIKSKPILDSIGKNYILFHTNFVNVKEKMSELDLVGKVDGILMDLGVSSPQFDDSSRGFTYQVDTELDMRMDKRNSLTAKEVINSYSLEDLIRIFKNYGDERYANAIARNIVRAREASPINSTFELVEIIRKSKPAKVIHKEGHPAKQVFQALRIEVNDELNVLTSALKQASEILASKGRLVVISFHSGEDKIVKSIFRELAVEEGNRINLPTVSKKLDFTLISHKPIVASDKELEVNNRAHSAKLRILERV